MLIWGTVLTLGFKFIPTDNQINKGFIQFLRASDEAKIESKAVQIVLVGYQHQSIDEVL